MDPCSFGSWCSTASSRLFATHFPHSPGAAVDTWQYRKLPGIDELCRELDRAEVVEPDVFYLYLDNADNNSLNDRIAFFGKSGTYKITTRWDAFESNATVDGPEIQKKYEEFKGNMSRFNLRQLELSRALRTSQIARDSIAVDSIDRALDQSLKRKYLYTLNFAHTHKSSELAPYVAWAEIADANPILLDSLYRALPADITDSKYGKKLKQVLEGQQ